MIFKSCYSIKDNGPDNYRPIWYFDNKDKCEYCKQYGIINSRAYTKYGLRRTGCVCCPFGLELNYELKQTAKYEPKLYRAVNSVFGKSFNYTEKYQLFRKDRENEFLRHKLKTVSLFDFEDVRA